MWRLSLRPEYLSGGGHVLGGLIVDNGTFSGKTMQPSALLQKFGLTHLSPFLRKETF